MANPLDGLDRAQLVRVIDMMAEEIDWAYESTEVIIDDFVGAMLSKEANDGGD